MAEQGVRFAEEDPELRGIKEPVARFYPIPMGIVKTIPTEKREGYHFVGVDGMDRCMKILDSLQKDGLSGYFLEMNACEGGCVGGPSAFNDQISSKKNRDILISQADDRGIHENIEHYEMNTISMHRE